MTQPSLGHSTAFHPIFLPTKCWSALGAYTLSAGLSHTPKAFLSQINWLLQEVEGYLETDIL